MEELESLLSPGRRIQALRTGGRDREVVVTFEGVKKREGEVEGGGGSKRRRVAYHTKAYPDWGREARQRTPGGGRAAGGGEVKEEVLEEEPQSTSVLERFDYEKILDRNVEEFIDVLDASEQDSIENVEVGNVKQSVDVVSEGGAATASEEDKSTRFKEEVLVEATKASGEVMIEAFDIKRGLLEASNSGEEVVGEEVASEEVASEKVVSEEVARLQAAVYVEKLGGSFRCCWLGGKEVGLTEQLETL